MKDGSSHFRDVKVLVLAGWIVSICTPVISAWPCGYESEHCEGNLHAPDPEDCASFYQCDWGRWVQRRCTRCGASEYCIPVTCPGVTTLPHTFSSTKLATTSTSDGVSPTAATLSHQSISIKGPGTSTAAASIDNYTKDPSHSEHPTTSDGDTRSSPISKLLTDASQTTTMQIIFQDGKNMSHQGGPSGGGAIAGTVIAVLLVLVILVLGLLWWKRRDMLLSLFNKGKGKNSTNEYDSPYVHQDPHGIKSIKENPTKNNNDSSIHIYSEPSKTSPKPTYNGDLSPVLMRNNTLYSAGTDEPFYNTADDPKYDAADSHDYTYTQPPGFKCDPKENHYYTTPGKADDVYYSTVAKEIDCANEQDRRQNGDTPQNSIPQYADVIPRSKRASDPNVADDIDDYCLAREPNSTNQQEPYYFVLENPAETTHYQNTT